MSSSSAAASVSYNQLGLTNTEQQILRQHAQIAQQGGHGSGGGSQSRGRGMAYSNSSSRAASAASSQGTQQRLMVDAPSLSLLQRHFDTVMAHIRNRIEAVSILYSSKSPYRSSLNLPRNITLTDYSTARRCIQQIARS